MIYCLPGNHVKFYDCLSLFGILSLPRIFVLCPLNEILLKIESIPFLLLLEIVFNCYELLTFVLFLFVYSSEEEVEEV